MNYDHNALSTIRLIQVADDRADHMGRTNPALALDVLSACPPAIRQATPDRAWVTLVILFASPGEEATVASARLARYLLAYQETWGRLPTLATVQRRAADRHLKEPRP